MAPLAQGKAQARSGIKIKKAASVLIGNYVSRLLSSSPIEAENGPGGHLAGLLTRTSLSLNSLPGTRIPVASANWFKLSALTVTG